MSSLPQGNTKLPRLKFLYIFSVSAVGLCVYRSRVFDTLTGVFIVDVGGSVRDKFAVFSLLMLAAKCAFVKLAVNVLRKHVHF
jgi:hypothetical protein